jgi:lysophospholipase L1-like esterase
VIADFEAATNAEIRRWAAAEDIQLIDAANDVGGRPHLFVDLAHFNDAGAAEMANLLLSALEERPTLSSRSR